MKWLKKLLKSKSSKSHKPAPKYLGERYTKITMDFNVGMIDLSGPSGSIASWGLFSPNANLTGDDLNCIEMMAECAYLEGVRDGMAQRK